MRTRGTTDASPRYKRKINWIRSNICYSDDDCLKWPFDVSAHGRGTVQMYGKTFTAPRAMCLLAHGEPPENSYHAAHSCGNGHLGCMNPKHLTWKTPKDNERDKIKHGTLRKGESINTCKLSEFDVLEIREKIGTIAGKELAKQYGVSPTVISNIKVGNSWAWLT